MEISKGLLEFKTLDINDLNTKYSELKCEITNLKALNASFSKDLTTSYSGSGLQSYKENEEFLTKVIQEIEKSFSTEIDDLLTQCQTLLVGIKELESKKNEYDSAKASYDNATTNKETYLDRMNKAEQEFNNKQKSLLEIYNGLLIADEKYTILKQYGTVDEEVSGTLMNYNGIKFTSIYYEKDGIIYQKVLPVYDQESGNTCNIDEGYVIAYNKEKILKAAEKAGDKSFGQAAIDFLNEKMNGTTSKRYLWDFLTNTYSEKKSKVIGAVMDQIMEDSYTTMGCKTVADYTSVAATVAACSITHVGYGSNTSEYTYGYQDMLSTNNGSLTCINFVRWAYAQGLHKVYPELSSKEISRRVNSGYGLDPVNFLEEYSYSIQSMSAKEISEIKIGSVLSKRCFNSDGKLTNYHVGVVIGHTIDPVTKEKSLVVAQSGSVKNGVATSIYTPSKMLSGNLNQWEGVTPPEIAEKRMINGYSKEGILKRA